jgi:methylglyoxal synthase
MKTIALIAHDRKKQDMVDFVHQHRQLLSAYNLIGTASTGRLIREETGLSVKTYLSGPLGGDIQIGAEMVAGAVDLVLFLRDPLTAQPHEPDISALLRIADVHNIPVATNLASAHRLLATMTQD